MTPCDTIPFKDQEKMQQLENEQHPIDESTII